MNRKGRLLAALLALFGLSMLVVEGAATSLCLPGDEASASVGAEVPHGAARVGLHHAPERSSEESPESRSGDPGCPVGMAGGGGSCMAISLPATSEKLRPHPDGREAAHVLSESTDDQLLVSAHFRPPRV